MTALARVTVEDHGEIPVVAIEGEIDASNAIELRRAIGAAAPNRVSALVVDLTAVDYVDSAGINLLFALGAELRDRQQRLHIAVDDASPVARMLEISGLAAVERTDPTRAAAVASAGVGSRGDDPT
jgi:anti-sigma B factor antagonist